MINTDRPLSLAEAGRQDVENALALVHSLVTETAAVAERTDPDPAHAARWPNEALHWHATKVLTQLIPIHERLSTCWVAVDRLLPTAARRAHEE